MKKHFKTNIHPVECSLALAALYREVQHDFNLVPETLAGHILHSARRLNQNPEYHGRELKTTILCLFARKLDKAVRIVSTRTAVEERDEEALCAHFNIYPNQIAERIRKDALIISKSPSVVAECYKNIINVAVERSFDESIDLIRSDPLLVVA